MLRAVRQIVLVEIGIFKGTSSLFADNFLFGAASLVPSVMNASASLTGVKEGECCTGWLLSGVEVQTASASLGDAQV